MVVLRRVEEVSDGSKHVAMSTVAGMVLGVCEWNLFSHVLPIDSQFPFCSEPFCFGHCLSVHSEEEGVAAYEAKLCSVANFCFSSVPYAHPRTMHHILYII